MSACTNCGARLTCSCQRRVSINGQSGCNKCIGQLNAQDKQNIKPATNNGSNAPQNVSATYNGPGKQV